MPARAKHDAGNSKLHSAYRGSVGLDILLRHNVPHDVLQGLDDNVVVPGEFYLKSNNCLHF